MWGFGSIRLFDLMTFSFFSILILYIIGESYIWLIYIISKKNDPFSSFDIYQKINYRIMFGQFFILIFLISFSIFSISFYIKCILIFTMSIIFFIIKNNNYIRYNLLHVGSHYKIKVTTLFCAIVFISIFIFIFLISVNLISGLYGSINDDAAFHTFVVRVILDNPHYLLTRKMLPYTEFINTYPPLSQVLSAFFVSILDIPIQKIIIMFSSVLPYLITLSFYSSIDLIFKNKYISILGSFLCSLFTFKYIFGPLSFGGIALLISFYISISSMGLIWIFLKDIKKNWIKTLLIGLIIFTSSQVYSVSFFYIFIWFSLICIIKLFRQILYISNNFWFDLLQKKNAKIFLTFLIPIIINLPYFKIIYDARNPSMQKYVFDIDFNKLTQANNYLIKLTRERINFNWVFDIFTLSSFFSEFNKLLCLASLSLPFILILYASEKIEIIKLEKNQIIKNISYIYIFFLFLMTYLTIFTNVNLEKATLFMSNFLDPERIWQHIFIPSIILTTLIISIIIKIINMVFKKINKVLIKNSYNKLYTNKIFRLFLLCIIIFNFTIMTIQNDYFNQLQDYEIIKNSLNGFSTLKYDDLLLMLWIKENTPVDALILVTAGDSGQYLTAVTQRKTIYSYSLQLYSQKYQRLLTQLNSDPSNLDVILTLLQYNITYVYIGSKGIMYSLDNPFRTHFNATKFLSTPYFKLVKQIGDSWLFQFTRS